MNEGINGSGVGTEHGTRIKPCGRSRSICRTGSWGSSQSRSSLAVHVEHVDGRRLRVRERNPQFLLAVAFRGFSWTNCLTLVAAGETQQLILEGVVADAGQGEGRRGSGPAESGSTRLKEKFCEI